MTSIQHSRIPPRAHAARTRACTVAIAIATLGALAAHAEPFVNAHRAVRETPAGGVAGRAGWTAQGANGATAGRRGFVADGQGNVAAGNTAGFTTANGAQGARITRFRRTDDGAINASNYGSVSGQNGSATRSGSYTRSADGSSASGERSTTVTNANTGNTFDATTTYTKGSGFSRSATCTDAYGNTVSCGQR